MEENNKTTELSGNAGNSNHKFALDLNGVLLLAVCLDGWKFSSLCVRLQSGGGRTNTHQVFKFSDVDSVCIPNISQQFVRQAQKISAVVVLLKLV